jgi:phospholipid/cholesterol/gamma-HCH transport system substrate-binding protein
MEVTVGAFMFMVLLALGIITIVLSRENIFAETWELQVKFSDVQGLRHGDNVLKRGVIIGRVSHLEVEADGVRVTLNLQKPVDIREDYRIELIRTSVFGTLNLSIHEGSPDRPALDPASVLSGVTPVDLMQEAGEAMRSIRNALEDGGIIENFKSTMRQINEITARLERGDGTLGKLLTEETVFEDIKRLSANLSEISERLAHGQGTLARLMSDDDTVYKDVQEITANLREVSERLKNGQGTLGKLLSEDDTFYRDLSESAAALRDISQTISRGEGSMGKLVKDEELYNEARLLMKDLRAMIDDFRETSPITTFTSVFFGAF